MNGLDREKTTWTGLSAEKNTTRTGNDGVVGRSRPSKNTTRPKSQLSNFARPNDGWTGLWVRPCDNRVWVLVFLCFHAEVEIPVIVLKPGNKC